MALYVQAGIGASLGIADFPRLTFDGFKKRKFENTQPWTSSYKAVKNISQMSSPAIKRTRSFQPPSSSHECVCRNLRKSQSNPHSTRYKRWSDGSRDALIGESHASSTVSLNSSSTTSQSNKQLSDLSSDSQNRRITSLFSASEDKPSINIINSHSSLKCGTNIKTWFIKVELINIAREDTISVAALGEVIKIKIKYGKKTSGIDRFLGSKQSVKKHLKFSGTVDPSSIKTRLDTDGCLIIQMIELLNY